MNRRILFVALFFMMLSGSIYMTSSWGKFEKPMLVASLLLVILSYFISKSRIIINHKLLYPFYLFFVLSLISSLINQDQTLFLGTGLTALLYISLIITVVSVLRENSIELVVKSIWWSQIPLIVIPLIIQRSIQFPYKGMFYNSNSFGTVAATLFAISCAFLVFELHKLLFETNQMRKVLYWLISSALLLFLCISSASRTSALTCIAIIAYCFMITALKMLKGKSKGKIIGKLLKMTFVMAPVYMLLNLVFPIAKVFNLVILNKFEKYQGNVLNDRSGMWAIALQDAKLFGNGRDYFHGQFEIGAHSTYISLIGQYGIVPFIFFALFLLSGLFYAWRFSKGQTTSRYRYVPFFMLITFGMLSMAEGMMLKVSMLSSFIFIGATSVYNRKSVQTETSELIKQRSNSKLGKAH